MKLNLRWLRWLWGLGGMLIGAIGVCALWGCRGAEMGAGEPLAARTPKAPGTVISPRSGLADSRPGEAVSRPASLLAAPSSRPVMQQNEERPVWLHDWPVPFGPQRIALTLQYIRLHYDPQATDINITPRMVVIHWTESPSLRGSWNIFKPDKITSERPYIRKHGLVNVSVQFLVGRDGSVHRLMPETWMGRHVIGLNRISIGIENAGSGRYPLTRQQLLANARLVRYLARKYPIRYLIGHHEYLRFRGSSLYVERIKGYRTIKSDPGPRFMRQLRALLTDLPLRDRP